MTSPQVAPPCIFVLFGASGDLTSRLVFPALYHLAVQKLLPREFVVAAILRKEGEADAFRERLRGALHEFAGGDVDEAVAADLLDRVTTTVADAGDPASFERLRDRLAAIDAERGTRGNRIFYLAVPPKAFAPIVAALGQAGMAEEKDGAFVRVVIEKPFGTDLESALTLNAQLRDVLHEEQIYRIDHYLGKETVQNILMLRFTNGLFEPIWSRMHIDHVQITVTETVTVGRRGAFYDETGALRDMVPTCCCFCPCSPWSRRGGSIPMACAPKRDARSTPSANCLRRRRWPPPCAANMCLV